MKPILTLLLMVTLVAGCSARHNDRNTPGNRSVSSSLMLTGLNKQLQDTLKRATVGNQQAQQQYGHWLVSAGQNEAAQPLLRNAAEHGDTQAQYLLGKMLLEEQPAEARRWLEHSAESGNAQAAKALSQYFLKRTSLLQRPQEGFNWRLHAAQLGDPQAQNDVGAAYSRGVGVKKNVAQALEWYRKSALQGYTLAQFNLAGAYQAGEGVKPNPALAYAWYEIASQSSRDAQLSQIIEQMKLRMYAEATRNGEAAKARLLVKQFQHQIIASRTQEVR
ncbi:tetratricopeptide repeat protein [Pantoea sp. SGAir0175]